MLTSIAQRMPSRSFLQLIFSRLTSTPVVTTIHGLSSERILPVYRSYDDVAHYVAVSEVDRHPDLTYAAAIHDGIDPNAFHLGAGGQRLPAVPPADPPREGRDHGDRRRPLGISYEGRAGLFTSE